MPRRASVAAGGPAEAADHYRAGPLTWLAAWGERHPARGLLLVGALTVALFAWGHAVEWLAGARPIGSLDPNLFVLIPYGPWGAALLAAGIRIGRRALDAFWPATGWPESEKPAWAHRLAVVPFGPEVAALVFGAVAGVAALLGAPTELLGPESGRFAVGIAYLPAFLLGYAVSAAAALSTIRWLQVVARIHREAEAVDVFDRAPIYAFSRLTFAVGLSFAVVAYLSLTLNSAFQQGNATSLAFIGGTIVASILVFTVPMWGIHGRLAREKEALLREVESRTSRLAAELYARVDAGEFDSTKVIVDGLSGIAGLRDRIERLPTWPWRPQLLRGFVSALLLPLVIFVLTRVISGIL